MKNNLFKIICKNSTKNTSKDISDDERIAYESNKLLGKAYLSLNSFVIFILLMEEMFDSLLNFTFLLGIVSYFCLIQFCKKGLLENNTAAVDIVLWSVITFPFAIVGMFSKLLNITIKMYLYIPLVIVIGLILYFIAQKIYNKYN